MCAVLRLLYIHLPLILIELKKNHENCINFVYITTQNIQWRVFFSFKKYTEQCPPNAEISESSKYESPVPRSRRHECHMSERPTD